MKRIQAENLKSIKFGFVQTLYYSEPCFVVVVVVVVVVAVVVVLLTEIRM